MSADKKTTRQSEDSIVAQPKRQLESPVLSDDIVAFIEREGNRIDVNVLLVSIEQKAENPGDFIAEAKEFLALTREFERDRLMGFKEAADAVIDIKTRDPDDIEKRSNNRARRSLKFFIAGASALSGIGSFVAILSGAGMVVTGMLVALGALSIAMLGPLASGESISSNDVVRIVNAVRGMVPRLDEARTHGGETAKKKHDGPKRGGRR